MDQERRLQGGLFGGVAVVERELERRFGEETPPREQTAVEERVRVAVRGVAPRNVAAVGVENRGEVVSQPRRARRRRRRVEARRPQVPGVVVAVLLLVFLAAAAAVERRRALVVVVVVVSGF